MSEYKRCDICGELIEDCSEAQKMLECTARVHISTTFNDFITTDSYRDIIFDVCRCCALKIFVKQETKNCRFIYSHL